jgi:myo-inositol-1(or 4)-monophosphatase
MNKNRVSAAAEIAVQAGKELLDCYQDGNSGGELKADRSLVTQADKRADRLIQDFLKKHFPGEGILSEEASTVFPDSEHVWVIDPLDGTVNFNHGLCYWGISIAHLVNGEPQDGVVYIPAINELYTASRGKGAFLNSEELPLKENPGGELFPLFVHCSRMHYRYHVETKLKKRSLGAAAHHLCLVAKGPATLALESTPRIWDLAAGWIIIKEAGAAISSLSDQEPFPATPGKDYARLPFPTLAAKNESSLAEALAGIERI